MTGWIILLLLACGFAILLWANLTEGRSSSAAEDRMSAALISIFGLALIVAAVFLLVGAGIFRLM